MEFLDEFLEIYQKLTPDAAAQLYQLPFLVQREKFVEHKAVSKSTLQVDVGRLKDALRESAKDERRRLYPLGAKSISVGRTDESDMVLSHISMSKKHATLVMEEGDGISYSVTDLGSTNGTFVGNDEIEVNKPRVLKDGDVVAFGSLEFLFYEASTFLKFVHTLVTKMGG